MNYKLAKQLKDAGFPQGRPLHHLPYLSGKTKEERAEMFKRFYVPTLSELIEACGDEFDKLIRFDTPTEEEDILCNEIFHCDAPRWKAFSKSFMYNGKTPEEAVAKLWLKLNEIS